METPLEIYEVHHNKRWIVLKDNQGNMATGITYKEALGYLLSRRKEEQQDSQ